MAVLRRFFRRHPRLARLLLRVISPIIQYLIPAVNRLRGPSYAEWFARWQANRPEDDATILAALGDDLPHFLIVLGPEPLAEITRESLQRQIGVAWRSVGAPDAAMALEGHGRGFVMVLEEGETLERHALASFALAARRQASARVFYADEDVREASGAFCRPWF